MAIEQVNVGGPLQAPVAPYVDGGVGVTLNTLIIFYMGQCNFLGRH